MKKMKKRIALYVIISIICVVAIAIAVYYQVFQKSNVGEENLIQNKITNTIGNQEKTMEDVKEEWNALFGNTMRLQKNDVSYVKKLDNTKEIVYSAYEIKKETNNYQVNINIPVLNIEGTVVAEFNQTTQKVFADKATEILNKTEGFAIYSVEYVAYVNGDILSIAIKSTLKEGNAVQRVMVQTYNYNMRTGKKVTLNEILEQKGASTSKINEKIAKEVKKAETAAEQLRQATGQTGEFIYARDLNSAIYITDNVQNFLIGRDGKIFIIYAYGNNNFTSEVDIIEVE